MSEAQQRLQELPNWRDHFEWRYVADHYTPCRVLDFGCGYGFSDFYLAESGFEVVGYDPDRERIAVALYLWQNVSDEQRKRVRFVTEGWPRLIYRLVWVSHVFEHIPLAEWPDIFKNLMKHAQEILISVPLGHAYDMPLHLHHWATEAELRADLVQSSAAPWVLETDPQNLVIRARWSR